MPEPGTPGNQVRMTDEAHALLALLARDAGVSMARYLERLILGQAMVVGLRRMGEEESRARKGKR